MSVTPIRDFTLGRLALPTLGAPITESLGSQLTQVGDSTAVGQRRAKGFVLTIPIHGTPGDTDLQAVGNRMRRQLRSLMQNHAYRLQGLYARISFDSERNGWLVIGASELQDANGGVPFAEYQLTLSDAFLVAQMSTHREGCRVALADRRSTAATVDYREEILNTTASFGSEPALALALLPVGATDVALNGQPQPALGQRTGINGQAAICAAVTNGDVIDWERPETSLGLGDVIVYDRRGNYGPFGVAGAYDSTPNPDPQALYGWQEVYGPTWPWFTTTSDTPVLQNGQCRVRFDSSNALGFKVDVTDGSRWIEQGKVMLDRYDGLSGGYSALTTVLSCTLVEYTPDRAVVLVVMQSGTDPHSREKVYITLQRGWSGPRFEIYSANGADGTTSAVGGAVRFVTKPGDTNDSVVPPPGGVSPYSTAGSGSALIPTTTWNTLTNEPFVSLLRQPASGAGYTATLTPVLNQLSSAFGSMTDATAYSSAANAIAWAETAGGYTSAQLGFTLQEPDQILEGEAIRNASSGTTSVITDATASAGHAVQDTQAAPTHATVVKSPSNLLLAKYRVLARVKVDVLATGSFRASVTPGSGAALGATVTTTVGSWVWLDLGEITPTGTAGAIDVWVTAWRSAGGSGNVYVDRLELVKTEDRARTNASYDGVRDLGQACLYDCQQQLRRLPRG